MYCNADLRNYVNNPLPTTSDDDVTFVSSSNPHTSVKESEIPTSATILNLGKKPTSISNIFSDLDKMQLQMKTPSEEEILK
jgi:hypothetical protein